MGEETSKKRPAKPFVGNEGNRFSSDSQPDPKAKSLGWQEVRKQRHLTQSIIKEMIGEDGTPTESFKSYLAALVKNAKSGNPKAIDAINRCIEDEITKIEHSGELAITQIVGMEIH
jgi:hypothetical protein